MPAYLLHHRLHALQRAQQLHALFRRVIQAFGRGASASAGAKARLAWIWDLSERRVLEPVDEQCLLAKDFEIYFIQTALCCLLPQRARHPDPERRLAATPRERAATRAEHIVTIAGTYTI